MHTKKFIIGGIFVLAALVLVVVGVYRMNSQDGELSNDGEGIRIEERNEFSNGSIPEQETKNGKTNSYRGTTENDNAPPEEIKADDITINPTDPLPPPITRGGCVVGGCSSQICGEVSASDGMVTTCEYRAEYACYQSATCERQSTGKCGWTDTSELRACIANAGFETI